MAAVHFLLFFLGSCGTLQKVNTKHETEFETVNQSCFLAPVSLDVCRYTLLNISSASTWPHLVFLSSRIKPKSLWVSWIVTYWSSLQHSGTAPPHTNKLNGMSCMWNVKRPLVVCSYIFWVVTAVVSCFLSFLILLKIFGFEATSIILPSRHIRGSGPFPALLDSFQQL